MYNNNYGGISSGVQAAAANGNAADDDDWDAMDEQPAPSWQVSGVSSAFCLRWMDSAFP